MYQHPSLLWWGRLRFVSVLYCLVAITGCRPNDPTSIASGKNDDSQPYSAEDVRFANAPAGVQLAGTLTLPGTQGPHPAMVLVSGSGPQDRDETVAGQKPFAVLADYLTRRGIAVLRYDDRGVGKSSGDFASATLHDFAADAQAAVEFLRSRPEVDSRRIGLAGHSEGGIVIPMAALQSPGQVACLVLLAAPGVPGEKVFYLQDAAEARAQGKDAAFIERSRTRKEQIFAILKKETDLAKAAQELRDTMRNMSLTPEEQAAVASAGVNLDNMIDQQIRMLNTPATRVFLSYDPLPALTRLQVPVLALTGERDLQVPPADHLPLIEAALKNGACPQYSVETLPGLNHLFQPSKTGLPAEYAGIRETFAPEALNRIADWSLKQMAPRSAVPGGN